MVQTRFGKLCFSLFNILLFGAIRARLEGAVFYTFLSLLMDVLNPLDQKQLKRIARGKREFVLRRVRAIDRLNGKLYDPASVLEQLDIYERHCYLQRHVIQKIERACKAKNVSEAVNLVEEGVKKGVHPKLITEGFSGAYWMRGANRETLGLFKPYDEEIFAPNNPVGPSLQGSLGFRRTRKGVRVGESAHREVAAFLVDSFFGFGIVPKTTYAMFSHEVFFLATEDRRLKKKIKTKKGSFQEFIEGFLPLHKLTLEQGKQIPLEEFQLLILLDIITGNADRNSGNFLVGHKKIAAIDHGLCFPDVHEELPTWYWTLLKQGEEPFYPDIKEVVFHFPFEEIGWKLKKRCFIEESALQRMGERMALLKKAMKRNLTPKEMAPLFDVEKLNNSNWTAI